MVSNGCTSCIAVCVFLSAVIWTASSLPVDMSDPLYKGISPEDINTFMALYKDDRNEQSPPLVDDLYGYPDTSYRSAPWAWSQSQLLGSDPLRTPIKRDPQIVARRGSSSNRQHTLNYLIRRLLALQGKTVPDGRTISVRFGSGRK